MAAQKIVITHPNESEIPLIEDVGVTAIKTFLEDTEKEAKDLEVMKIKVTEDIKKMKSISRRSHRALRTRP